MVGERARAAAGLPIHATVFLDDKPVFTEKGGVFHASYSSGDAVFSVALTPHTFLAGLTEGRRVYDEWEARQRLVAPLRRRKA